MHHPPTWLEACEGAREAEKIVNAQNILSSFTPRECQFQPNRSNQPIKIQKLSLAKMGGWQSRGLCYNHAEKWVHGHKCRK